MERKFKVRGILLGVTAIALVMIMIWQIRGQFPQLSTNVATDQQSVAANTLSPAQSPLATPTTQSIVAPEGPPTATTQPVEQPQSPLPSPTSPVLAQYKFGEPQFVYTAKKTNWIVDWLDDKQRVLLVEYSDTVPGYENIEVLDTTTGQVTRYGTRISDIQDPVWLKSTQQVAFVSRDSVPQDVNRVGPRHLYLGKPIPTETPRPITTTQILTDNATALQVAPTTPQISSTVTAETPIPTEITPVPATATPIATQIAAETMVGDLLVMVEESGRVLLADAADPSRLKPSVNVRDYSLEPLDRAFGMEPHPTKPEIAIFGDKAFLILNTATDQVQKLSLEIGVNPPTTRVRYWARDVKWSPDGSTIAVIVVEGQPVFHTSQLRILDIATGEVRKISLPLLIVSDIAWAPNGKQLIVRGRLPNSRVADHYLVDTATQAIQHLDWQLPDIYNGGTGMNLAWTTDGTKLLFRCAASFDSLNTLSLCLVDVQLPKE